MADQTVKTLHSFLKQNDTKASSGGTVRSYSHDHGSGPILCMVHGYPESSYMWRHMIPMLKDRISLFIPELPGYGISSLPPEPDKRTVGNLLIESLQSIFGKDRPVIYCGHDRGARVGHRLLVDNEPSHNIKAAILIDIVPTLVQYQSFANPAAAVAYYHWPFLATDIAPAMIEKMGGGYWCDTNLKRVKGGNEAGIAKFKENDAWDHYCHQFQNPDCIAGSCADYMSGATGEPKEQEADQTEGKKIRVPTLVLFSASNLGKMHDVPAIWPQWIDGELKCIGIPDGYGHFLAEEAPEATTKHVTDWIEHVGK